MAITTREILEIVNFNMDQLAGFEAQMSSGRSKLEALWPEHFRGKRVDDFRWGGHIARCYLAMRRGYAIARRKARARDFKEVGMTDCILPEGADRKEEQLDCLRSVVRMLA